MITGKNFLRKLDEVKFESKINSVAEQLKGSTHIEDIAAVVESIADVDAFKKASLVEYLDKNKDKLLAMATYTEGDPVKIADDFAPHANKHGVVVSHGSEAGTYKVKFEDGEYDIPAHHISRRDVVANESVEAQPEKMLEHKCLALLNDGTFTKVLLESFNNAEELIEEQIGQSVMVVFPEAIHESFMSQVSEESLTDEQKQKREDIVLAMKKNEAELKKRYGDKWENVMYAIATKKALEESLADASRNVIFKQSTKDGGQVKIIKDGEYFAVERLDRSGTVINKQEYSNVNDAEKEVQTLL